MARHTVTLTPDEFSACVFPDRCLLCLAPAMDHRFYEASWAGAGAEGKLLWRASGRLPAKAIPYCGRHAKVEDLFRGVDSEVEHRAGRSHLRVFFVGRRIRRRALAEHPEMRGFRRGRGGTLGVRFSVAGLPRRGRATWSSIILRFDREDYAALFRREALSSSHAAFGTEGYAPPG